MEDVKKMPDPPQVPTGSPGHGPASAATTAEGWTVRFAPLPEDAETRGAMADKLSVNLVDISDAIIKTMDHFSEHYKWEVEVSGQINVHVFSGSAKLKLSPK
jgi:hypothetical protein